MDFGYDNAERLNGRSMLAGTTTLGYDASSGHLVSLDTSANIDLDFAWDGFLPITMTMSGELSGQVSQDFDSDFFLISEAVNSQAVSFAYDNDGLLVQAGSLSLPREPASGLLAGTTLGVVSESIDYNDFAEPVQRQVEVNGNPLFAQDFSRDKLGRIDELTETLGGSTGTLAYSYDVSGRLIEVRQNDVPIETYTFDANSNRIQSTTAAGTIDYNYDNQDRLIEATGPTGTTSYAYTDAGELQSKTNPGGTTTYNYDAAGNLRQITLPDGRIIDYLIDGLDRRVGKQVDGALVKGWLYRDLLNPVAELDGDGNVVARFVYGERANVPEYMIRDGKTYRIVADHLGSPRLVIDTSTGEVVQQMDYNTFGKVITDSNPGFQPFGFAGGLYDTDTGLVRFGARDYDPETGRWTAKDPIRFAGGDPNLYGYVLNDPVNLVDPSGEIIPLIIAGAAVGSLVNVTGALIANGGSLTGQQLAAAITTGAIAGAAGAVAAPIGGTIARALGGSSAGLGAASATATASAAGSATGQAVGNAIDPCNVSSLTGAALFGGLGGGLASKFFPTPGIFTVRQARFFAPSTFSGVNRSNVNTSLFVSSGVGAAANFSGPR